MQKSLCTFTKECSFGMTDTTSTIDKKEGSLFLILLCYAGLYLVWGSTYLFIRYAVETIPPLYVVGSRFLAGGIIFTLISLAAGRIKRVPTVKEVGASFFLGSCLLLGGNGLVTIAEQTVDSHLAALVLSCTPVAVALFDRIFIGKKLSFVATAGILAGCAGVALLLYNPETAGFTFTPGIFMVVGALVSWSFATSLGHKIKVYPDVFVNSGLQMLFVGGVTLTMLGFTAPLSKEMVAGFTFKSLFGVGYLAIFGSATFCAYNYLIKYEPAVRIVSYAFVNPLIAIALGILFAGEKPKQFLLPGTALILLGLFAMLYGDVVIKKMVRSR